LFPPHSELILLKAFARLRYTSAPSRSPSASATNQDSLLIMNSLKSRIIALILVLPAFHACSVPATGFFGEKDKKDVIWEAGTNQYFKYADIDTSRFGENQHPVDLDANRLHAIIGSLKIRKLDKHTAEDKFEAVFTAQQVDLLSEYLVKGLSDAKPDQDIIFAMQKTVERFFGLEPEQFFVAGRVFYKNDRLNIIIGDYNRPRLSGYEAAYDPTHMGIVRYDFDFGKRKKPSGFDKTIVSLNGVENKEFDDARRRDWLVIDVDVAWIAYEQMMQARKNEEIAKKRKELKEVLATEEEDIEQAEKEQKTLRQQVEQLEQEVQAERPPSPAIVPATAGKPATTKAAPAIAETPAETSLEERLRVLKRLLDQGLITEDIYNRKVEALLDESL